jgi:predicted ATP-binding protein involved in virulence
MRGAVVHRRLDAIEADVMQMLVRLNPTLENAIANNPTGKSVIWLSSPVMQY